MKNIVVILICFLLSDLLNGQSNHWKFIGSPDTTEYIIVYVSSQGYIFAQMEVTNTIIFSEDKGNTWREIADTEKFYIDLFAYNAGFRENKDQMIYVNTHSEIFLFDPVHFTFTMIFRTNIFEYIKDFVLYENGQILLVTETKMVLLSPSGIIINSLNLESFYSATLLHGAPGEKNYIYLYKSSSHSILEYSDDLQFLGNETEISDPGEFIHRTGPNIVTGIDYSSDGGKTWIRHSPGQLEFYLKILSGHDHRLYLVGYQRIYISNDYGKNFSSIPNPLNQYVHLFVDKDTTLYINSNSCNENLVLKTENSGLSWDTLHNKIGISNCTDFEAGLAENLFALDGCFNFHKKDTSTNTWSKISIISQGFEIKPNSIFALSDGSLLSYFSDDNLYKSFDNGNSWQKTYTISNFGRYEENILEIDKVVYILGYDTIYISSDYAETFQKIAVDNQNISLILSDLYLTNWAFSKNYYFYHFNFFTASIEYYNFLTGKEGLITVPNHYTIINFTTSYLDNTLYILAINENTNLFELMISRDNGQNFDIKPINNIPKSIVLGILSDHINNLYLASEKNLLISHDNGHSWADISPDFPEFREINDLRVSYDNYLYLATTGCGILKYEEQLKLPKQLEIKIYGDLNADCLKDSGEKPVRHVRVVLNNEEIRPVDESGAAIFFTSMPNNIITLLYDTTVYDSCQQRYEVHLDTTQNQTSIDIPLQVTQFCAKPAINVSAPFLRRCFDNKYYGLVCNEGTIPMKFNTIQMKLDSFFTFISGTLPVISFIGNIIHFELDTLSPGECKDFSFVVNVSCDADFGKQHCIEANIITLSDTCFQRNSMSHYKECQENIGAFDPNDKNIFVNGNLNQTYVQPGEKIEYMIRFQNTGTDTAFTVKIEDPIGRKFDIFSIRPVVASHSYQWTIENHTLVVVFNDIKLVDSFANEPLSHGFIKFEIELKNSIQINEEFSNHAGIYFDFNVPVVTNEVVTSYGKPSGTHEIKKMNPIQIIPNPCNDFFIFNTSEFRDKPVDIFIFDMQGKVWVTKKLLSGEKEIDVKHMPSGSYIILFKQNDILLRNKLVKI